MTCGGVQYHSGTSKLICEISRWTGSCVMQFLLEGHPKPTMILYLCQSRCFSIRGGDALSCMWDVESFLEQSLICWLITGFECVFTLVQVRLSGVKKIL